MAPLRALFFQVLLNRAVPPVARDFGPLADNLPQEC